MANEEVCVGYVRNSIGIVTALNPIIGYKNSTKIAKEAMETGRGVYELVLEAWHSYQGRPRYYS